MNHPVTGFTHMAFSVNSPYHSTSRPDSISGQICFQRRSSSIILVSSTKSYRRSPAKCRRHDTVEWCRVQDCCHVQYQLLVHSCRSKRILGLVHRPRAVECIGSRRTNSLCPTLNAIDSAIPPAGMYYYRQHGALLS